MKRILSLLVLIGFLVGCTPMTALLKLHGQDPFDPSNHDTLEFTKIGWSDKSGEGYTTWTFVREEQEFLWQFYGDDNNGKTPCFRGEPWTAKKWSDRNPWHNWGWYWMGIAYWDQALVPYSSYLRDHLESFEAFDIGLLRLSFTRDTRHGRNWHTDEWGRTRKNLYPFLYVRLPFNLKFWIGWKPTRGQFAISLKVREEE